MTDPQPGDWLMPDGWTTTHLIRPDVTPPVTACGRHVGPRLLLPELTTSERCGQCVRRAGAE